MQTRWQSLFESCVNIGSGFVLALVVAEVVFPLYGYEGSPVDNLQIVVIFTAVSVARSYIWRRVFNWLHSTKSSAKTLESETTHDAGHLPQWSSPKR